MDTRDLFYLLFFTIIFSVIFVILFIAYYRKAKKTYDQFLKDYRKELDNNCAETLARLHDAQEKTLVTSKEYEEQLQLLQQLLKEIEEKKNFNQTLYKLREEELSNLIENKKKAELEKIDREVEEWAASAQEAASFGSAQYQKDLRDQEIEKEKELGELCATVDDYKARRDVINQEILRARAIEEQQDFYRVQLPESSKEDITFLLSIIDRFNNKEIIYKLIWSEYIQKPFKSMLNRVLSGRDPKNVIYMIKNMDTNEIYIGKTKAEVSKRWTEHIKTSLNIGTISRTNIHKALFNNWDKFSFTVLEEVPSDVNLGEREKYYIKFYESDVFGYNIKSGG